MSAIQMTTALLVLVSTLWLCATSPPAGNASVSDPMEVNDTWADAGADSDETLPIFTLLVETNETSPSANSSGGMESFAVANAHLRGSSLVPLWKDVGNCPPCFQHCKRMSSRQLCDGAHKYDYRGQVGYCWPYCPCWNQCAGSRQSPVALPPSMRISGSFDMGQLRNAYGPVSGLSVSLEEHGLTLHGVHKWGSLSHRGSSYAVKSFHFHCPAEHPDATGGRWVYPACEMHVVHENEHCFSREGDVWGHCSQPQSSSCQRVVLAVRFDLGGSSSGFLRSIGVHRGTSLRKGKRFRIRSPVDLGSALRILNEGVFTYPGSLTTPPCDENVQWIVSDRKVSMSVEQFSVMHGLGIKNNAREPFRNKDIIRYSR